MVRAGIKKIDRHASGTQRPSLRKSQCEIDNVQQEQMLGNGTNELQVPFDRWLTRSSIAPKIISAGQPSGKRVHLGIELEEPKLKQ